MSVKELLCRFLYFVCLYIWQSNVQNRRCYTLYVLESPTGHPPSKHVPSKFESPTTKLFLALSEGISEHSASCRNLSLGGDTFMETDWVDVKQARWQSVDWIYLAQDVDKGRAVWAWWWTLLTVSCRKCAPFAGVVQRAFWNLYTTVSPKQSSCFTSRILSTELACSGTVT
jgi:hypothetical protein